MRPGDFFVPLYQRVHDGFRVGFDVGNVGVCSTLRCQRYSPPIRGPAGRRFARFKRDVCYLCRGSYSSTASRTSEIKIDCATCIGLSMNRCANPSPLSSGTENFGVDTMIATFCKTSSSSVSGCKIEFAGRKGFHDICHFPPSLSDCVRLHRNIHRRDKQVAPSVEPLQGI